VRWRGKERKSRKGGRGGDNKGPRAHARTCLPKNRFALSLTQYSSHGKAAAAQCNPNTRFILRSRFCEPFWLLVTEISGNQGLHWALGIPCRNAVVPGCESCSSKRRLTGIDGWRRNASVACTMQVLLPSPTICRATHQCVPRRCAAMLKWCPRQRNHQIQVVNGQVGRSLQIQRLWIPERTAIDAHQRGVRWYCNKALG
jgi:hypothetical protein